MDTLETLKTLQEAIVYFANPDNCVAYMVSKRWKNGVICPNCGSREVKYMESRRVWQCKTRHPKSQFSVKVGSVYEDSAIALDKWLTATWMLNNCKNGVSSYEVARSIGVTQKSAWFMLHRIRTAMGDDGASKLGYSGPVEIDETFVGGKVKNIHKGKRKPSASYQGGGNKAIVLGMLERGGKVRANTVADRRKPTMQPTILENVAAGAHIITDEHSTYPFIAADTYYHEVINHVEGYVRDHIHTNGIENFWSLLKRGLTGTYISVDPIHLDKYVTEQVFRYNNRKGLNDGERFGICVEQTFGKRLTYKQLTGKTEAAF
ncbi:MAG TPA: IS1595 family transposase [Edaphobacter sp.]|nr:IS1595 family transposase [Edaphobacter sp.]